MANGPIFLIPLFEFEEALYEKTTEEHAANQR